MAVRYLEQGNISLVMERSRSAACCGRTRHTYVRDLGFVVPYDWWEHFTA
jgi:hypothetical protein